MALLTVRDLNRKNMAAQDLFEESSLQVFSKKTGLYLGLIRQGEADPDDDLAPDIQSTVAQDQKDERQLQLF